LLFTMRCLRSLLNKLYWLPNWLLSNLINLFTMLIALLHMYYNKYKLFELLRCKLSIFHSSACNMLGLMWHWLFFEYNFKTMY